MKLGPMVVPAGAAVIAVVFAVLGDWAGVAVLAWEAGGLLTIGHVMRRRLRRRPPSRWSPSAE